MIDIFYFAGAFIVIGAALIFSMVVLLLSWISHYDAGKIMKHPKWKEME